MSKVENKIKRIMEGLSDMDQVVELFAKSYAAVLIYRAARPDLVQLDFPIAVSNDRAAGGKP